MVFDIDVPKPTTVSGEFTIGGQVPPDSVAAWGRVLLRDQVTGDEVPLGATSDGHYSSRVAPGRYQIHYRNVASAGNVVPVNGNAIIGAIHVPRRGRTARRDQHRDIDVPIASLDGKVLINGVVGPDSPVGWGKIFLEDRRTSDAILLANTRDSDFETTLVPGAYDVFYEVVAGASGLVPDNEHSQIDRVALRPEYARLGTITVGVPEPSSFVLACIGFIIGLRTVTVRKRRRPT